MTPTTMVIFGRYHNVAFVSDMYPPTQMFYYHLHNSTHGVITNSKVNGDQVFQFELDWEGQVVKMSNQFQNNYKMKALRSIYPTWYLSDTGDSVALLLKKKLVLFDILITKQNQIVHLGKVGRITDYPSFPIIGNLTFERI